MEYYSTDSDSMQAAIDAELLRIRQLSPEDAAAAVVAAVKKAKAAIAEAEEAEKVAEEADRDAEEAKSVAEELKRKLEEMKARPGKISFIILLSLAQLTPCSKKVIFKNI